MSIRNGTKSSTHMHLIAEACEAVEQWSPTKKCSAKATPAPTKCRVGGLLVASGTPSNAERRRAFYDDVLSTGSCFY